MEKFLEGMDCLGSCISSCFASIVALIIAGTILWFCVAIIISVATH